MNINELIGIFKEKFGEEGGGVRVFSSPGRVNLIGEHTDYNGGYVFPAALSMSTTIIARKREDNIIRLMAIDLGVMVEGTLDKLDEYKTLSWGNYQLGVASELIKAGYNVCGADLLYYDTVPLGSGLSSSAAIEVATALCLASLGGCENPSMVDMAVIGQRAENNYVGVNCGIMDQFASAMGKKDHALFLNCKTLEFSLIKADMKGYKLVIGNTNKKRSLCDSKYNERRAECEKGLSIIAPFLENKECLGDITLEEFENVKHHIKDEIILKRVTHIIEEDDRVLKAVKALEDGDILYLGKLLCASHDSLKHLYEVTGVELDTIVEEMMKVDGTVGARMTGAGFGGCSVAIVKEEKVDDVIKIAGAAYKEKIGYEASFYVSEISDGGREIKQ